MGKKTLVLGVILIISLGLLAGCSSGIKFNIGYEGKGYTKGAFNFTDESGEELGNHNLVKLVKSVEELRTFCAESNNPAFLVDNQKYPNNLSKKIREYDEAFFAEKALIVVLLAAKNAGVSYTVKNLNFEKDTLFVSIKVKETKGNSAQVITPWTFLIEINQADTVGITDIKIN